MTAEAGKPKLLVMDLRTWIEAEKGRLRALAKHLGTTPSAISQWLDIGVPIKRMESVVTFTRGEVTLEAMVLASIAAKARKAKTPA